MSGFVNMLDHPQGSPGPRSKIVGTFLPAPMGETYRATKNAVASCGDPSLADWGSFSCPRPPHPSPIRPSALQSKARNIARQLSLLEIPPQFKNLSEIRSEASQICQLLKEVDYWQLEESRHLNRLTKCQAKVVLSNVVRRAKLETTLDGLTPECPIWQAFTAKFSTFKLGAVVVRSPPRAQSLIDRDPNISEGVIFAGYQRFGIIQLSATKFSEHWFLHSFLNPEKFSSAFSCVLHEFIHGLQHCGIPLLKFLTPTAAKLLASYTLPIAIGIPEPYAALTTAVLCFTSIYGGLFRVPEDVAIVREAQSWSSEFDLQAPWSFRDWVDTCASNIVTDYIPKQRRDAAFQKTLQAVRYVHALRLIGWSEARLGALVARTTRDEMKSRWTELSDCYEKARVSIAGDHKEMFEILLDALHFERQIKAYGQFLTLRRIVKEEVSSILLSGPFHGRELPSDII